MYDNDDSGYISKDELAHVLGVCTYLCLSLSNVCVIWSAFLCNSSILLALVCLKSTLNMFVIEVYVTYGIFILEANINLILAKQALPEDYLPQDISHVKMDELFEHIDTDSDGRISFQEFRTALHLQDAILSHFRSSGGQDMQCS